MEGFERLDDSNVRFSSSPRRSPNITHSINSPVRSVHPEMIMESLNSQADFAHRTADFFDDTTESEGDDFIEPNAHGREATLPGRKGSPKRRKSGNYLGGTTDQLRSQCEGKRASSPTAIDAYMRLTPATPHDPEHLGMGESLGSSYVSSVEEMTPSKPRKSSARIPAGNRISIDRSFGGSRYRDSRSMEPEESPILPKSTPSNKADQILGVHALTMHALLRNEEALDMTAQSLTPPHIADRTSQFRLSSEIRNSRYRATSAPIKKVSMAPPPINTGGHRNTIPENIVRTPYPFHQTPTSIRKSFRSPLSANTSYPTDSILTLSLASSRRHKPPLTTTITLPATTSTHLSFASPAEKDAHFATIDFDDTALFLALHRGYGSLSGPFRFISARTLSRIVVSGPASQAADAGYGWLAAPSPRSPRKGEMPGLSDSFSEAKLMRNYLRPKACKARYAWVGWAHRLADAPLTAMHPALRDEEGGRGGRQAQTEGLEFVVGWSIRRILAVLALVILASVASALCWVFLGRNAQMSGFTYRGPAVTTGGGFRDAGDRVAPGVLIGVCVLLLGLTGMGGWIGGSWLLM